MKKLISCILVIMVLLGVLFVTPAQAVSRITMYKYVNEKNPASFWPQFGLGVCIMFGLPSAYFVI